MGSWGPSSIRRCVTCSRPESQKTYDRARGRRLLAHQPDGTEHRRRHAGADPTRQRATRRRAPGLGRRVLRVHATGVGHASHHAQLRGRHGEQKAIGAIRHDLLVAYYHIVRDQVPYRDLGPKWQRKRYSVEHRARRLQRQLEALGYAVTLDKTEPQEQAA